MQKGEVPKKESYFVYKHRNGENVKYHAEVAPSDNWEDALQMSLPRATGVAAIWKKRYPYGDVTICIGRNVTQVDPLFPIIVV